MTGVRRTLLALPLVASLLLGVAPSAGAATWRHDDAAGDALVVDHKLDGTDTKPATISSEKRGDITRETVSFTRDRVQVAMTARSITAYDAAATLKIATSRGDTYTVSYLNNDNTFGPSFVVRRNGYRYECDGIANSRTRAGLLFRLPASCLDSPYRIRVGLQTRMYSGRFDDVNEREIRDDAYRTGKVDEKTSKLSPWIVVG